MDLDCYFNFREQKHTLTGDELECPVPVAQIDLMGTVWKTEIIPTYPLISDEVPMPVQEAIPLAEWSEFEASVAGYSTQLLHHRSTQLEIVYFGVLILFLILLTFINLKVSNTALCAVLLSACLICVITFAMVFNHLPAWHDEGLDKSILEVLENQPFAKYGYSIDYLRQNRSEGLHGTARLIRIFPNDDNAYQQPVLESSGNSESMSSSIHAANKSITDDT